MSQSENTSINAERVKCLCKKNTGLCRALKKNKQTNTKNPNKQNNSKTVILQDTLWTGYGKILEKHMPSLLFTYKGCQIEEREQE